MRVLVACEFSGVVREAFATRGHDAWSCDLLPSEQPGNHIQGNVLAVLQDRWDLMIGHPPCTHLAASGARWWPTKQQEQAEALEFVRALMGAPIPRICIENPVSLISTAIRKPDQVLQPYLFGHAEVKTTCLWLTNLARLVPTSIVRTPRYQRAWRLPPSADRWKERSRTYTGIAGAMAVQWGGDMPRQMNLWEEIA